MERRATLVLGCLLALAACSGKQQDSTATAAPPPGTGPVHISKSNVFSPLVQDLNKAKAVNGQVQDQANKANQSLENDTAPAATTSQP
jgi:ABC-type glycerol-3-phosphate transport system substrate-binding protein